MDRGQPSRYSDKASGWKSEKTLFHSLVGIRRPHRPTQSPIQWAWSGGGVRFPGLRLSLVLKLTIHVHLVMRLRMRVALASHYVFRHGALLN